MRCHLCLELPANEPTSVVLLSNGDDPPYIMRLCDDHAGAYRGRRDATLVNVPPLRELIAA